MIDFIWHSTYALIGIGGLAVIACAAVAWFFPPFRTWAIEAAVAILGATAIYAKGARDQSKRVNAQTEKAVGKAKADNEKIDARPDTPDDVDKRLRDGSF
jgi:hypothetical protein